MENLITPRFQNFLTIGVMLVGWMFIGVIGAQVYQYFNNGGQNGTT